MLSDVSDVFDKLRSGAESFKFFCSGIRHDHVEDGSYLQTSVTIDLDVVLQNASAKPIAKDIVDSINFSDKILYIYTSGTTGLPKAAVIKHSR